MPQLTPIVLTSETFNVTGNADGTTSWATSESTFNSGHLLSITRRTVTSNQTTRKSALRLTRALESECETSCVPIKRGALLASLDFVSSVESTPAERLAFITELQEILQDTKVAQALANNEAFWS